MLNMLNRWLLAMRIYDLEILIVGQTKCIKAAADPSYRNRIEVARHNARGELARLRSEYNATLPVGKRRTWKLA